MCLNEAENPTVSIFIKAKFIVYAKDIETKSGNRE